MGDQNNKVFHRVAQARAANNGIRVIQRESDGVCSRDIDEIKQEAEDFFLKFLQAIPEDHEIESDEFMRNLMPYRCSEVEKNVLTMDVMEEEIKSVLFAMRVNKSPGPDGYSTEFFKAAWPVLGPDLVIAIQSFFITSFIPSGVNSNILALLPKKLDAISMKHYRPIACCNVLYKIISKILARRLKSVLPGFITQNQTAFVKERLLQENVLLATELVKDYHKENISPRCSIKFDISKAFDTVEWEFLVQVLRVIEVPEIFIKWIFLCISAAWFFVQVNGELAGFFKSRRGLRQGCSLSTYLFVMCMNVQSLLLNRSALQNGFGFHPNCEELGITHLSFPDDIMAFSDGSLSETYDLMKVFLCLFICQSLHIYTR